jgi:hypothetical protein
MTRSKLLDVPADQAVYLTGCSTPGARAAARGRGDLGVLVTPMFPKYLDHVSDYAAWAVDNGAFSSTVPFCPAKFRKLVADAAAHPRKADCLFVAAPDVVGDPIATLARFREWRDELRASGLPVAFVLQDGCETFDAHGLFAGGIPWGEFDVLFIGGSTEWKIGDLPWPKHRAWMDTFRRCDREGVPVHMGRVNSAERLDIASYGLGCRSADGTYLKFGPTKNLPILLKWLDRTNRGWGFPTRQGVER